MKNKFKKWNRVNLYNPRVNGYGKKQFIIVSDKEVVMPYIVGECKKPIESIITSAVPHYAVLLNEKVKYIPAHELRLAVPYLKTGDKVTRMDSEDGDVYTITKIDKETNEVWIEYANGGLKISIDKVELITEKWVEYCENKYKDIVIPQNSRQMKQKGVKEGGFLSRLGINLFKTKKQEQN